MAAADTGPLTRTRRNMIGVGVLLMLVHSFGWSFPDTFTVFGASMDARPSAVAIIFWVVLGYLCYEYFVHLKVISNNLRSRWRGLFGELFKSRLVRAMKEKYRDEALLQRVYLQNHTQVASVQEAYEVTLSNVQGGSFRLRTRLNIMFHATHPNGSPTSVKYQDDRHHALDYFLSPLTTLWTSVRLFLSNDVYFEFVFPLLFPLAAIAAWLWGPFDFLVAPIPPPEPPGWQPPWPS